MPEKRMTEADFSRGMQTVYIVTMWSGGVPSRKWKTLQQPKLLPQGTGVSFRNLATKLTVHLIGSISVEQFEQGSEALLEEEVEMDETREQSKPIF